MNDWNGLDQSQRDHRVMTWIQVGGRSDRYVAALQREEAVLGPPTIAQTGGATLIDPADPRFPPSVADRIEAPGPWFVRGVLPRAPMLAVVGSRTPDYEGERLCKRIVGELAAAGVVVVSGGALGIDTLAHEASLASGTPTVAMLPAALDRLTPRRNVGLFERIVAGGGALVTEYPPGVGARKFHFHRRNHLIAAFADAVLVVRSKASGGTMITARAARSMGTPLLAVPGSPEDATAAGCNALLRNGARCVTTSAEILDDIGFRRGDYPLASSPVASPGHESILQVMVQPTTTLDQLVERTQLDSATLLVALTELEMSGRVRRDVGGWRRTR